MQNFMQNDTQKSVQANMANKGAQGANRGLSSSDMNIRQLLRDEEGFLRRAGAREFTQAVLYFRSMASKAVTPQARDFYIDRANQFSLRAVQGGGFGRVA